MSPRTFPGRAMGTCEPPVDVSPLVPMALPGNVRLALPGDIELLGDIEAV